MFNSKKAEKPISKDTHLLAAKTPLKIPIRTTMAESNLPKLSLENPLEDYKTLMEEMSASNLDDDQHSKTYKAIAEEARKTVWKLLFEDPSAENEKKAAELLKEHKMDACFYVPWDYNDWIVLVRDELLKREMLDFWHNVIVKESLGLCCARDSDYFDDMQDPVPVEFYRHGGAVAPWKLETPDHEEEAAQEAIEYNFPKSDSADSLHRSPPKPEDVKISLEHPLEDYRERVKEYLSMNTNKNDDEIDLCFKAIAVSTRDAVWGLLFEGKQPPTEERQQIAGDLLRIHKSDACFYAPWAYNEWIVKFRDELLRRELLDFWRDHIVKYSLGPCCFRDCDFFDDTLDPAPTIFYGHAGCVAPWVREAALNGENVHNGDHPE